MTNQHTNTRGRPAMRRRQVLGYVNDQIASEGRAPSYGQICAALGIGTRCEVSRIVARLESMGQLRRVGPGSVRRIALA